MKPSIQVDGDIDVTLPGGAAVSADGPIGLFALLLAAGVAVFFIYMKYGHHHVKKVKGIFKRRKK